MVPLRVHDVTMPVSPDMLYWIEGQPPRIEHVHRLANGDESEVTRWTIGAHTGTHIDAPRHFYEDGITVDQIPIETLVGPCRVVDVSDRDGHVDASAVEAVDLEGVQRVLFRTSNSTRRLNRPDFVTDYVGLGPDAAEALVEAGVKLIGIDYVTAECWELKADWPSHHLILGAGSIILEGVNLSRVEAGVYMLCCQPLQLVGAEAAPTRTTLLELA